LMALFCESRFKVGEFGGWRAEGTLSLSTPFPDSTSEPAIVELGRKDSDVSANTVVPKAYPTN
jgi:hypothetical protein